MKTRTNKLLKSLKMAKLPKSLIVFLLLPIMSCSNFLNQKDLDRMELSVKQHIKNNDQQENTITQIEYIKPIEYIEIPKDQRKNPDEVYLFKIYIKAKWSYADSYRIYNIDDTLKYYFDKDKKFVHPDNGGK